MLIDLALLPLPALSPPPEPPPLNELVWPLQAATSARTAATSATSGARLRGERVMRELPSSGGRQGGLVGGLVGLSGGDGRLGGGLADLRAATSGLRQCGREPVE